MRKVGSVDSLAYFPYVPERHHEKKENEIESETHTNSHTNALAQADADGDRHKMTRKRCEGKKRKEGLLAAAAL